MLVLCSVVAVMPSAASATRATTLSACNTTQLNVVSYNVSVATGSVGVLFWVADTSSRACTLHGYPRVSYIGNYGTVQSKKSAQPLEVPEAYGKRRFDLVGVAKDRALPMVNISPDGAIASFWVFGTDMPQRIAAGNQSRCIVSYEMRVSMSKGPTEIIVTPVRAGNFDFCGSITIYPIVSGDTGSDPSYPLDRVFGPTLP